MTYSCLKNPMNRGAWQATVCGVAKIQMSLNKSCIPKTKYAIIFVSYSASMENTLKKTFIFINFYITNQKV